MNFADFTLDFIIGGASSGVSVLFSNPINVYKHRMQLEGQLETNQKKKKLERGINVIPGIYKIIKHEGMRKAYKGTGTSMSFQMFQCGICLGGYKWVHDRKWLTDEDGQILLLNSVVAGGLFGSLGGFLASPILLVKLKQITERGAGCDTKFWPLLLRLYRYIGFINLWTGSSATALYTLTSNAVQLTVFEKCIDFGFANSQILKENYLANSFVACTISSVSEVTITHPLDLISTRLFNQGYDKNGKGLLYSNFLDCLLKTVKAEGIKGLYKGIQAHYIEKMPQVFLMLMIWSNLSYVKDRCIQICDINEI